MKKNQIRNFCINILYIIHNILWIDLLDGNIASCWPRWWLWISTDRDLWGEGQPTDNTMYSLHLRKKCNTLSHFLWVAYYHLGLACENLPRAWFSPHEVNFISSQSYLSQSTPFLYVFVYMSHQECGSNKLTEHKILWEKRIQQEMLRFKCSEQHSFIIVHWLKRDCLVSKLYSGQTNLFLYNRINDRTASTNPVCWPKQVISL